MTTTSKKRKLNGYNGGEPGYRASRLRAAMACSEFNRLPEDCSAAERAAAWRQVICPCDTQDESSKEHPKKKHPCAHLPTPTPTTPPLTPTPEPLQLAHQGPPSALAASGSQPCAYASGSSRVPLPLFPDQLKSRLSSDHASAPVAARANRTDSSGSEASNERPSAVIVTPATSSSSDDAPSSSPEKNRYPKDHGPYVKGPVYVDYGQNVHIGKTTFINRNCHILDSPVSSLHIGERCLLGPNVHLYCVTHTLDAKKRTDGNYPSSSLAGDIRIGDDCWIGGGAIILPDITIGDGAVVGAGSVVTRDVPAHHLAVGVPAKVIRCLDEDKAGCACNRSELQHWIMRLLGGKPSIFAPAPDVTGIKAANARIRVLEIAMVVLMLIVAWLLYRDVVRGAG